MFDLDVLPYFLAAAALIALGAFCWRSQRFSALFYLAIALFLGAVWSLSEAFAILSVNLPAKLFWLKVTHSAMALMPVAWLALVITLTGLMQRLIRRYLAVLFFVPFITILILWTGNLGFAGYHGQLMMRNLHLVHISNEMLGLLIPSSISPALASMPLMLIVAFQPGPWFVIQLVYSIALVLLSYILAGRTWYTLQRRLYREARAELIQDEKKDPGKVAQAQTAITSFTRTSARLLSKSDRGNQRALLILVASSLLPILVIMVELAYQLEISLHLAQAAGQALNLSRITLYCRSTAPAMQALSAVLLTWVLWRYRSLYNYPLRIIPVARSVLVESMRDGVLVLDRQDRIVDFNAAAQNMLSEPAAGQAFEKPPPLLQRGMTIALALVNYPELLSALNWRVDQLPEPAQGAAATPVSVEADSTISHAVRLVRHTPQPATHDQTVRFLDLRLSPIVEKDGKSSGRLVVLRDITERKQAELALSASEQRHRRLVEQLAVLNRIGLAIFTPGETAPGDSSPRSVEAVIHVLYQQCQQIGEIDCFYVALYDESSGMLRFPVFYNRTEAGQMEVTSYGDSHIDEYPGLTAYVIRSYQTLWIHDLQDVAQLPVYHGRRIEPIFTSTRQERSFVAVPLILGAQPAMLDELVAQPERPKSAEKLRQKAAAGATLPPVSRPAGASQPSVVGVISMQSFQPNLYTEEQVKLLETVAVQAAIALENSRLYEQVERELEQRCLAEDALRLANRHLQAHVEEIESLQASLHASLDRLADQAMRDPLTGLFNRRYLHETLERELARAARLEQPVSLVMADIDFFKPLNDTYLHEAGDQVLKVLADLLETQSRHEDIACRIGGEEFVVLMPGASLETAYQRAEQWRVAFTELEFQAVDEIASGQMDKIVPGSRPGFFRATISLGVAVAPQHGLSGDELLHAADRALYDAKVGGRNQTRIYSAQVSGG